MVSLAAAAVTAAWMVASQLASAGSTQIVAACATPAPAKRKAAIAIVAEETRIIMLWTPCLTDFPNGFTLETPKRIIRL
jgi:predicted phosphoribosyltransferase